MDTWWGRQLADLGTWVQDWLPVISVAGVFVTALVAYLAYRQALDADRRDQWWARAQWAIESALDTGSDRQLAGLIVLTSLKTSSLAAPEDAALFDAIAWSIKEGLDGGAPAPRRNAVHQGAAPRDDSARDDSARDDSARGDGAARDGAVPPASGPANAAPAPAMLRQAEVLLAAKPTPPARGGRRKRARSPISEP
ncbi:hypothetical protein CVV68_15285 [Arthrobacter livingstonensis]|uniref:Uncharacterized protein n=1 Tax=Arthrobacter livingstonensis TaxID=670078 RepID=A0A2V5LSU7_9MICC|nr:hypothetical protein [Arthrobacter livingstonensis]PYI66157.1 hypothetical protein CVV68_15285 [Arthrobacter livingstonensis]